MARISIPRDSCLRAEASPDLCMICGCQPSERAKTQTYNASYCSPVAILGFFLFSIFGFFLLYFLLRKQQPVLIKQCAACARQRGRLPLLLGLNWVLCLVSFFGGIGLVAASSGQDRWMGSMGLVLWVGAILYPLLFWLFYSRRYNVACTGINDRFVWLDLPNASYNYVFRADLEPVNPQPLPMTCQHCRAIIPSDANFCLRCGQGV